VIYHIGQQVGHYRLVRLLGVGSFAEVYLGEHLYLGSQAAIKVLHTHIAPSGIAQFQQEGQMLAKLIHPGIMRVLDFGIDGNNPYLIMDYAPGGTLRSRHPKGTGIPLPTVVEYVKQIGGALQYAHDRKLIHRDVKPENMLIGRNGDPAQRFWHRPNRAEFALPERQGHGWHHLLYGPRTDRITSPSSFRPIFPCHRRLRMALWRAPISRFLYRNCRQAEPDPATIAHTTPAIAPCHS